MAGNPVMRNRNRLLDPGLRNRNRKASRNHPVFKSLAPNASRLFDSWAP